jgi:hypothetical protein
MLLDEIDIDNISIKTSRRDKQVLLEIKLLGISISQTRLTWDEACHQGQTAYHQT